MSKKINPEKGVKYDNDKPRWCLLPWDVIEEIVVILTFGANKYADDNWKVVPDAKNRYKSALMRHLKAYFCGEYIDPESGRHHLAHAGCCLVFLFWFELHPEHKIPEDRKK